MKSMSRAAGLTVQSGLSTKIAGMVFWGMVAVGLLAAVVMLQVLQHGQEARYQQSTQLLAQRIAVVMQAHSNADILQANGPELAELSTRWQKLGFQAVELKSGAEMLRFGQRHPDQYLVTQVLPSIAHLSGPSRPPIVLKAYFEDPGQVIAVQRNNLMLAIGLVVIIFGIALQHVLNRMLSRPFASMVDSAKQFAAGNTGARVDEHLNDEFGFLAKFINQALNSLMAKQEELLAKQADLHAALARATASEAALSREKELAEVTLQSITDAVITANADGRIQYMNPAAERLTGWTKEEAYDQPLEQVIRLLDEINSEPLPNPGRICLQSNEVTAPRRDAMLAQRDDQLVSVDMSAAPMRSNTGTQIGVVVAFQDVSQARRLSQQLAYQASHDTLTGLPNRVSFDNSLNELLALTAQDHRQHALLYLDLDQFKIINDTCGHMAGDELLRQISQAMHEAIRHDDTLARLGGDEFAILLRSCGAEQARQIAQKLHQRIQAHRFVWQERTFQVGASIGLVIISSNDLNRANILSAADLACYAAKETGRNRIHVYQHDDAALATRQSEMHLVNQIVDALNENRFLLYRQSILPITSTTDWATEHHEILIRMTGPDESIVMPDRFIPAAERYDLMPQVDRWVIRKTFNAIASGEFDTSTGKRRRMVAINLSGSSLDDEGMLEFIYTAAKSAGVALQDVCFEVTETAAIRNLNKAVKLINELRALGCRFALDDFGSGLSSFGYLKALPVDYIKIDGGFVKDMVNDPIDRGMVEAIHQIGQVMRIRTIAECVENESTKRALQEIGIDFVQGYHVGRPVKINLAETQASPQIIRL